MSSYRAWLTCAQTRFIIATANANGYQGPNTKQLQGNVGVVCFSPENREAT